MKDLSKKTNPDGRRTLQSAPVTCRRARHCANVREEKNIEKKKKEGENEKNQPQKT